MTNLALHEQVSVPEPSPEVQKELEAQTTKGSRVPWVLIFGVIVVIAAVAAALAGLL